MLRFRTLTQRFGALYALVIASMLGVSVVVTLHLFGMRVDSERLMEEAREQSITAQLIAEIDALTALLEQPTEIDSDELGRARDLLGGTLLELAELEGHADDPSRVEHQDAEERIAGRLEEELRSIHAELSETLAARHAPALVARLAAARHYAAVLNSEAHEEAEEANLDLNRRAKATGVTLLSTWLFALLLLSGALYMIQRGVVRPLRALRAGSERFGHGELDHRVSVENADEIGELASSFNAMADRLAHARDDLEGRVRDRTREFLRAARLADLGLLASGIAHEINTPLASIASSAEGLQRRAKNGDLAPELIEDYTSVISEEAFRARDISTRMLALVRQEQTDIGRVPLHVVVEQAASALRHRAEQRGVALVAPEVPPELSVSVNAGELVQVLVNLLANAIDASPRGGRVAFDATVQDGELALEVRDEGSGIAEEDLDRIFEPFYTTKAPGSGTGLGLALVATMVKARGGHVAVRSELGRGSTFRVTLPEDWSEFA